MTTHQPRLLWKYHEQQCGATDAFNVVLYQSKWRRAVVNPSIAQHSKGVLHCAFRLWANVVVM